MSAQSDIYKEFLKHLADRDWGKARKHIASDFSAEGESGYAMDMDGLIELLEWLRPGFSNFGKIRNLRIAQSSDFITATYSVTMTFKKDLPPFRGGNYTISATGKTFTVEITDRVWFKENKIRDVRSTLNSYKIRPLMG